MVCSVQTESCHVVLGECGPINVTMCNKGIYRCVRAHAQALSYHYMLPPYKGRRPDGHTRDLRDHSPVLGSLPLFCLCLLLSPLYLARATVATAHSGACATGGARTRDLPTILGHRILTAAEKGLSYVSDTNVTQGSADA